MADEDEDFDPSEETTAPIADPSWMHSSDEQVAARANPASSGYNPAWASVVDTDASQAQASAFPWHIWSASAPFAPGTDSGPAPPVGIRQPTEPDGQDQRGAQITRINESDPYISAADGRWKKQSVNPATGEINETDILDSGMGKIDRGTGNIYAQTSQGSRTCGIIGVDPQQQRLAQIVGQKTRWQAQGSPMDEDIAATKSSLLDTQRQLQPYLATPDRMNAVIAKYSALGADNPATADQLRQAQSDFTNWKQQNPGYSALVGKRDALTAQIQAQTAARAQRQQQVSQLLSAPGYVRWSANTPPWLAALGQNGGTPDGSAPEPDIGIHEVDARAGVIAAQNGFPAALAYVAALNEARQNGARTVDGDSIDDAIGSVHGVPPSK